MDLYGKSLKILSAHFIHHSYHSNNDLLSLTQTTRSINCDCYWRFGEQFVKILKFCYRIRIVLKSEGSFSEIKRRLAPCKNWCYMQHTITTTCENNWMLMYALNSEALELLADNAAKSPDWLTKEAILPKKSIDRMFLVAVPAVPLQLPYSCAHFVPAVPHLLQYAFALFCFWNVSLWNIFLWHVVYNGLLHMKFFLLFYVFYSDLLVAVISPASL